MASLVNTGRKSGQISSPSIRTNILEVSQNPSYARSKYPTQLAKISFDEISDLTADVFSFYIVHAAVRVRGLIHNTRGRGD